MMRPPKGMSARTVSFNLLAVSLIIRPRHLTVVAPLPSLSPAVAFSTSQCRELSVAIVGPLLYEISRESPLTSKTQASLHPSATSGCKQLLCPYVLCPYAWVAVGSSHREGL